MDEWGFFVDKRIVTWKRIHYVIKEESLEDAQRVAKENIEYLTGYYEENGIDWCDEEILYDSEHELEWGEFSDAPTVELYWMSEGDNEPADKIWDNTPVEVMRDRKISQIIDK
jgi:hypothetical protein